MKKKFTRIGFKTRIDIWEHMFDRVIEKTEGTVRSMVWINIYRQMGEGVMPTISNIIRRQINNI